MVGAKFDQYLLGPRFYRLEFERSVAMRRLALQQYPLELADVSKDIVRTMESVVKATMDYSEELAIEARKVSTYLKAVDMVVSSSRISQISELIEGLECTVQRLIRYGWLVEREWNTYVRTHAPGSENSRRSSRMGVFPTNYLRSLGTWHMVLANAITRTRFRSGEAGYSGSVHAMDSGLPWKAMGVMYTLNPTHWSSGYLLEKAKAERAKGKKPDPWLDAVPQVTSARPGHRSCTQSTDIRRRNPFHYAAQQPSDLIWLRRFQYLDRQDTQQKSETARLAPLAAPDLFGFTPLTVAAKHGNLGAVKYIVEEAGVDAVCDTLVDAAVFAFAEGHHECLAPIINRMVAFPEKVALVIRLSMFYGFEQLIDRVVCASKESGDDALAAVDAVLEKTIRKNGECSVHHLAALNGKASMIKYAVGRLVSGSAAYGPHERNSAGLTPLDIANYFGYRECAEALIGTYPSGFPPAPKALDPRDAVLQPRPFTPNGGGFSAPPEETYAVFVTLGTNDTRRFSAMPPISLDAEAVGSLFDESALPRSTHLLLRIDSEQGMETNNDNGWLVDVSTMLDDPTMSTCTWQPPAHFYTVYPERLVLKLELIALVDQALSPFASDNKVIAHAALTIPTSYIPSSSELGPGRYAPVCSNTSNYLHAVFLSSSSGDIVGEANLEVVVATPYMHRGLSSGGMSSGSSAPMLSPQSGNTSDGQASSGSDRFVGKINDRVATAAHLAINGGGRWDMAPWYVEGQTLVYGHRGSGMNVAPESRACRLQLGENTVLSMEQAVKDGAFAVEFDVQLTRDMAPVIYHDWNVSETGMDIPVNALTLSQFLSHGPRSKRLSRSRSCSSLGEATSSSSSSGAAASMANSASTVQAPFATLRDLFESLPESVGFDIEIKYPMADEADEAGVCTSFEMNLFVDQILDVVLSYTSPPHLASSALPPSRSQRSGGPSLATPLSPGHAANAGPTGEPSEGMWRRRPIVFTSFHPDICLLLAHKVSGRFPIMLLTDAGMSRMADCRCNSLNAAVKLCKWMGLSGIVSHVSPIAESPRVAFLVRRHELALGTYGKLNNQARYVRLQKLYGVDVVIADDVPAALAALSPAAGAARPVA